MVLDTDVSATKSTYVGNLGIVPSPSVDQSPRPVSLSVVDSQPVIRRAGDLAFAVEV